ALRPGRLAERRERRHAFHRRIVGMDMQVDERSGRRHHQLSLLDQRVAPNWDHLTLPPWARQDAPFSPGRPGGAPFDKLRANGLIPVMLSSSKHDRTRAPGDHRTAELLTQAIQCEGKALHTSL